MASLTQWTWVWVNSRSWWWTGRPGMLQSMGSQRVGHDWATKLNWTELINTYMHINTSINYQTQLYDGFIFSNIWYGYSLPIFILFLPLFPIHPKLYLFLDVYSFWITFQVSQNDVWNFIICLLLGGRVYYIEFSN